MASLIASNYIETVFSINCPVLSAQSSSDNQQKAVNALAFDSGSTWNITLACTKDTLKVKVSLNYKKPYCNFCGNSSTYCQLCKRPSMFFVTYKAIHIVPLHNHAISSTVFPNDMAIQNGSVFEGSIDANNVIHGDRFLFDIVLTTRAELSRKPVEPPKPDPTASRNREVMQILLKDTHSVDLCFTFNSDKSYSNVGLWAHRSILSRYKPLADLIRKSTSSALRRSQVATKASRSVDNKPLDAGLASTDEDDSSKLISDVQEGADGDSSVLTILVEKFSLATFCVLLRFIYTGEINMSADTNQHAISSKESSLVLQEIGGKTREYVRWNPLDVDSPWKFKDVTWGELLLAANFYGVTELQTQCEDALITGLDAANAVEVLFSVGCHFEKVRNAAMDFIVENMASMVLGDKEPFALYKDHPNAFGFLVELMRRRVAKELTTAEAEGSTSK